MKKTAILLLVFVWLVLSLAPVIQAAPTVSAQSAVVIDADTGKILYERDAHQRRGMASTTKIMTALVAMENIAPETVVSVDPRACGVEGSSIYLFENETITVETLLYALMLQSANDAAEALAYAVAGSIEAFADMMNAKAAALGLTATHFENPHGLDGETHYTTAYELSLIAAEALENELFAKIVSTEKKMIPLHNGTATRLLVNHNRLLREYEDIIGVKTGFTKKCGRTLVSAAERDGVRLICVTLNDGDDWRDHRALLDYGFSLYGEVRLAEVGEYTYTLPVCGGVSERVTVKNRESLSRMLPETHGEITSVTELPRFLYAGVCEGDTIGRTVFYADGKKIGEVLLYAEESIGMREEEGFWQKLLSFLLK